MANGYNKIKRPSRYKYYIEIAKAVSQRSTCLKRRYGCIIVKNDEIIATGYNGAPRSMPNCCDIFSECPRKDAPHNSGDYSDCPSVHAEQNAMLSAARKDMIGGVMYLYGEELDETNKWKRIEAPCPCPICSRMISNAGISEIKS